MKLGRQEPRPLLEERHALPCAIGLAALAALAWPAPGARAEAAATLRPAAEKPIVVVVKDGADQHADHALRALESLGHASQRSELALSDLLLAAGCNDVSASCLDKACTTIGARALLIISQTAPKARVLRLEWYVPGAKVAVTQRDLPLDQKRGLRAKHRERRDAALAGAIYQAVEQMTAALAAHDTQAPAPASKSLAPPPSAIDSVESVGALSFAANVPRVAIAVDGQQRGETPLQLDGLPTGSYQVSASRQGYSSWRGQVTVTANRTTTLRIGLVPVGSSGYLDSVRWPTWVAVGTSAACAFAGIGVGAHMSSVQRSFDGQSTNTLADMRALQSLGDDGQRESIAANVLFGVAGAALVTAVVLSYFDYRSAKRSVTRGPNSSAGTLAATRGTPTTVGAPAKSLGLQASF